VRWPEIAPPAPRMVNMGEAPAVRVQETG